MICDSCVHGGNCLQCNASIEDFCAKFKPLCRDCYFNKAELVESTVKVRQGKKIIEKPVTKSVHKCARTGDEIQPTDFCSKGKKAR